MFTDNDDSDENLMLAYQTGNQQAFARLYQRYRQTLFAYLVKTLGQKSQAEEVYQEIWLSLIRQRERYTVSASFRTYIFCMLIHFQSYQYARYCRSDFSAWRCRYGANAAEAEEVTYQARDGIITLKINAKLQQDASSFKSNEISYNLELGEIEAKGDKQNRVQLVFPP